MYKKVNLFLVVLILGVICAPGQIFVLGGFLLFSLFLFRSDIRILVSMALVLAIVMIRFMLVLDLNQDYAKLGSSLNFSGEVRICADPDIRREEVKYIICPLVNEFENGFRYIWSADLYPKFKYGDVLKVYGELELPSDEADFSYRNFLKIYKVAYLFESKSYDLVRSESSFLRSVLDFKEFLIKSLDTNLHEPISSLAAGLLLGVKRGFSDELMLQLKNTGLTHLIAVSGFNVSLIILALNRSLFFVPRFVKFYIIVVFLGIFGILTGLSPSVVRAIIMGVISVLALEMGSEINFFRIILLTSIFMFLINPYTVWFDAGFHLSFLATLGVVYLSKFFMLKFLPKVFGLQESFALTIASQIATLPVIILNFGLVSVISPVANLLVAPLIPILMLLAFLLILTQKINLLFVPIVLLLNALGEIFFMILNFTSQVPYAYFEI